MGRQIPRNCDENVQAFVTVAPLVKLPNARSSNIW